MVSLSFTFSILSYFYTVSINQPISPTQSWAWQTMEIPVDPTTMINGNYSWSSGFAYPKTISNSRAFAIKCNVSHEGTPITVDFRSVIVGDDGIWMFYTWPQNSTWTLYFGMQM